MNYQEVKDKLLSDEMNISIPGTERIYKMLEALGNPQDKLDVVHVVGTNGKGSVSTMLANIFTKANVKVGLFNSPYITELTEYISVSDDGSLRNISEDEFAAFASIIFEKMNQKNCKLTHFEFITVLAVLFYSESNCKLVVMEAGLGGKYDATNIFKKDLATVITATNLDHTGILGNTVEEIVGNKLGIACKGGVVIASNPTTYLSSIDKSFENEGQEALNKELDKDDVLNNSLLSGKAIIDYCKDNKHTLIYPAKADYYKADDDRISFSYKGYKDYYINSQALYQLNNACLSIEAANYIADVLNVYIDQDIISQGLANFSLKSRFEIVSTEPLVIVDGAHNPACAKVLYETINNRYNNNTKKVVITGVMADKELNGIYYYIDKFADEYIVVDNGIKRAKKSVKLASLLSKTGKKVTIAGSTKVAATIVKNYEGQAMFIFAGTLYMTDAFKREFKAVNDSEVVNNEAKEIINRLTSKSFYSKSSNLPDMEKLLKKLDSPQEKLKTIHIAGTNGKGSTSKMLYQLLADNNLRVGLFTSPYIEIFNERIQFNGQVIENDYLVAICQLVLRLQEEEGLDLNQFGLLTCIAYIYYNLKECDYIVMETGLGGTYDPTNLTKKPEVTVITNIGFDHMAVLGNSLKEIAGAKAGIIKANVPLACYCLDDESMSVVDARAKELNAKLVTFNKADVDIIDETNFIYLGNKYTNCLVGDFQCYNATNAINAYMLLAENNPSLNKEPGFISTSLSKVKWPGRLEKLNDKPLVYIDGGHNVQCVSNVMDFFKKHFKEKKLIVIAGFMKDKDYPTMLDIMSKQASKIHLIPVNYYRSLSYLELTNLTKDYNIIDSVSHSMEEAYKKALESYDDDSVILITGSLYQISDAYKLF